MQIFINEKPLEFVDGTTLSEILILQSIVNISGVAIAVNDNIIRKSKWAEHRLNEKDNITIIKATQGG